jgi:L-rhamnose mutarotase
MEQIAFRMRLRPGQATELAALLHESGVRDYSIFLDEERLALFAVLRRTEGHHMDALPQHPVMQRWWAHMADLMETGPSLAPQVTPLQPMFHLP